MPLYPFLVLEVGSGPQVPTFRNSTFSDPQVGLTRDLGVRQVGNRPDSLRAGDMQHTVGKFLIRATTLL
jgi:hypothetical protein